MISSNDYDLILKNIGRFITLDESESELFISLLKSKSYKAKEYLLKPGQISKYEIFISKGCVKNYIIDKNGFEHINMFAIEDWWTSDMQSFITENPATHFIQALENTEVLQISKANTKILYQKIPKFERFFRILYQNSLVTQIERIDQNIAFSAEERYLCFIQKYPKLEQRLTQKQMAAYLGITPEFLSVIRNKLTRG